MKIPWLWADQARLIAEQLTSQTESFVYFKAIVEAGIIDQTLPADGGAGFSNIPASLRSNRQINVVPQPSACERIPSQLVDRGLAGHRPLSDHPDHGRHWQYDHALLQLPQRYAHFVEYLLTK